MNVPKLLETLTTSLTDYLSGDDVRLIGIHRGGVNVARYLHQALANPHPLGLLDISFYRDDFSQIGLHPEVKPSTIPFDVDEQHIVLIDDVIQTGRTIRAALNEIFDYGRPRRVTLACLIELEGHELPIRPDVKATSLSLDTNQRVKLHDLETLTVETITEGAIA